MPGAELYHLEAQSYPAERQEARRPRTTCGCTPRRGTTRSRESRGNTATIRWPARTRPSPSPRDDQAVAPAKGSPSPSARSTPCDPPRSTRTTSCPRRSRHRHAGDGSRPGRCPSQDGWSGAIARQEVRVTHGTRAGTCPCTTAGPTSATAIPAASGLATQASPARSTLLRLPPRFELDLTAELEDGTECPLGTVAGRRAPLRSGYDPELRPLIVTTLGRTGSTWLIHLLAGHPAGHRLPPLLLRAARGHLLDRHSHEPRRAGLLHAAGGG